MKSKLGRLLVIAFTLVVTMSMVMVPVSAKNGPSTGQFSSAYVKISNGTKTYTIMSNREKTNKLKGVSYSKTTNTLTLNNVKMASYVLSSNEMGDDFKITVKGSNSLMGITVWGFGWGGNVEINGKGSLTLNSKKKGVPIQMAAEGTQGKITIGPDTKVTAYKTNKKDYNLISIVGCSSKSAPLNIQGKVSTKPTLSKDSGQGKSYVLNYGVNKDDLITITLNGLTKKGSKVQYAYKENFGWTSDISGYPYNGPEYTYYEIYKVVTCKAAPGGKIAIKESVSKKIPSTYTKTGKQISNISYYSGYASSYYVVTKKGSKTKYAWAGNYDPDKEEIVYGLYKTIGSFTAKPSSSDNKTTTIYIIGDKVSGAPSGDFEAIQKSKTYTLQTKPSGTYNWFYTNKTLTITPAKAYTVKFNANGGKKLSRSSVRVASGKKIGTLPTAGKKGYTLKGWYTAKTKGTKVSSSLKIKKARTLYAHWTKVSVKQATKPTLKNTVKGKLTVNIDKVTGAKGYQITYSTNSKFKNAKSTKVSSRTATFTKLTKNKTYYFKVRAYKRDSLGYNVYGKYSQAATITFK